MKKVLLSFVLVLIFVFITACEPIEPADASNGKYSAQYPQTVLEYNLFMSKHLTIVSGQLTSRMTAIKNSQNMVSSIEMAGAKESYNIILEEINIIKATQPAKTYKSTRETTLIVLDAIKQHYEAYLQALEEKKDTKQYIDIFKNDFNEITGLYSLYNN